MMMMRLEPSVISVHSQPVN